MPQCLSESQLPRPRYKTHLWLRCCPGCRLHFVMPNLPQVVLPFPFIIQLSLGCPIHGRARPGRASSARRARVGRASSARRARGGRVKRAPGARQTRVKRASTHISPAKNPQMPRNKKPSGRSVHHGALGPKFPGIVPEGRGGAILREQSLEHISEESETEENGWETIGYDHPPPDASLTRARRVLWCSEARPLTGAERAFRFFILSHAWMLWPTLEAGLIAVDAILS